MEDLRENIIKILDEYLKSIEKYVGPQAKDEVIIKLRNIGDDEAEKRYELLSDIDRLSDLLIEYCMYLDSNTVIDAWCKDDELLKSTLDFIKNKYINI